MNEKQAQDNLDKILDIAFMNEFYKIQEAREKAMQDALILGCGMSRLFYDNGKFIVDHIKPEEFYKDL